MFLRKLYLDGLGNISDPLRKEKKGATRVTLDDKVKTEKRDAKNYQFIL